MAKIRFEKHQMKLLVTRISGIYEIFNDKKKEWSREANDGSFKINNPKIYDELLSILSEAHTYIPFSKENSTLSPFSDWIVFEVEFAKIHKVSLEKHPCIKD